MAKKEFLNSSCRSRRPLQDMGRDTRTSRATTTGRGREETLFGIRCEKLAKRVISGKWFCVSSPSAAARGTISENLIYLQLKAVNKVFRSAYIRLYGGPSRIAHPALLKMA